MQNYWGLNNPAQIGRELPVDFMRLDYFNLHSLNTVFNAAVTRLPIWVYVIGENGNPAGTIDVGIDPGSGSYIVVSQSRNPDMAKRILQAVEELERHAGLNGLPENIRQFRFSAKDVNAVWNETGDGFFIPFQSIPLMPAKVMAHDVFHDFLKNPPPSGNVCPIPARP